MILDSKRNFASSFDPNHRIYHWATSPNRFRCSSHPQFNLPSVANHRLETSSFRFHWLILAMIAGLSTALVLLQYKWTGQVAEAEMKERQAGSRVLASRMTLEFDDQLAAACDALMPTVGELDLAQLIEERWRLWQSQLPRQIFAQVGSARQENGQLILSLLDLTTGRFMPTAIWPSEWQELKINLEGKTKHRSGPFYDPAGMLLEFPLHSRVMRDDHPPRSHDEGEGRPRGGINHWLIFLNYMVIATTRRRT